jgi:Uma2 family endonuclease
MAIQEPKVQTPSAEAQPELLTGEELAAMGNRGPCELIEGRLVQLSPTKPRHGEIENNLAYMLTAFVRERKLGKVQVGEVGIYTHRNPDTIRGADILFISRERLARTTPGKFLDVAPELVVEILSPDDSWSYLK